jgi:hypothetical protein
MPSLLFTTAESEVGQPLLRAAAGFATAETARGVVYEDLNSDGLYQDTEPGVPGVTVSNGFDVTDTDADGRYRIAIEEGDTLFITKPSGWAVPSSLEKLPRFY